MATKRVTNEHIQRELGEISILLKGLRHDIEDIKQISPRVKSLELFRSYIKGGAVVLGSIGISIFTFIKGVFGQF